MHSLSWLRLIWFASGTALDVSWVEQLRETGTLLVRQAEAGTSSRRWIGPGISVQLSAERRAHTRGPSRESDIAVESAVGDAHDGDAAAAFRTMIELQLRPQYPKRPMGKFPPTGEGSGRCPRRMRVQQARRLTTAPCRG